VFSTGTVRPNPAPRNAVATSSTGYAAAWLVLTSVLASSSTIETVLQAKPSR
jgi:hypothetical protein